MVDKKFLKIKCFCAGLLILSLFASSILVPILPSVDPKTVDSEIAEPINDN